MRSKTYNIVLTGTTLNGTTMAVAHENLARVFKMTPAQARAVFAKAPLTVKRGLDEATAKQFMQAFKQAQIHVRLQESAAKLSRAAPSPDTAEPDSPRLPNDEPLHRVARKRRPAGLGVRIEASQAFGFLSLTVAQNEALAVDAATVVSSDAHISCTDRKELDAQDQSSSEIHVREYSTVEREGEICLSPSLPGHVVHMVLHTQEQELYFKNRAFLAASAKLDVAQQTMTDEWILVGGHARCTGEGNLWLQVCGSVLELELQQKCVIDPRRLVAWTGDILLQVGPPQLAPCVIAVGSGTLWLQSQSEESLIDWAQQFAASNNMP